MPKHHSKRIDFKRGFTLIEIIVVVAIIGILTSIAAVSIGQYLETTYMMKANQTAKTLFFAVQNQLTEMKAGDALDALNLSADSQKVVVSSIVPEEINANFTKETVENANNIRYLLLSKSGTDNAELTAMLKPYIADPEILNNSILIEYNVKTAVLRSVFYSERANTFTYSGGEEDLTNVIVRNGEDLRTKGQGYYGVDYTGKLNEANVTYTSPKVKIVNGDRLTVEWSDSYTNIANASYDLSIVGEDGTQYLKVIGIQQNATNVLQSSLDSAETFSEISLQTLVGSDTVPITKGYRIAYDNADTSYPFKLILDSLDNSISANYPSIAVGNIKAEVTASGTSLPTKRGLSNMEHSYYASEAQIPWLTSFLNKLTPGTSYVDDIKNRNDPVYGLSNPRHLNNIRYASEKSNFKQLEDIDWAVYLAKENKRVFKTLNFSYITDLSKPSERTSKQDYQGCFYGNGEEISNITIINKDESNTATDNAGFFASTGADAVLSDITLEKIQVSGKDNVGALAGSNAGIIKDCTAGALNDGSLITGASNVGGIAGRSLAGTLERLENFGGVTGKNFLGGVVGRNADATNNAAIDDCKNHGALTATSADSEYIGGIAGFNDDEGTIKNCQNVLSTTNADEIASDVINSITNKTIPAYNGNFVGGIAGYNNGAIQDVIVNSEIHGANYVGGLVGQNDTQGTIVKTSGFNEITVPNDITGTVTYAGYDVSGAVVASGKVVGGIVGENLGNTTNGITLFVNKAHVIGASYVGGIFGINGASLNDDDTLSNVTGKSSKIIQCFNRGFVYGTTSYTGGITGYNVGTITNCENDLIPSSFTNSIINNMTKATCDYVGGITGYNNGTIQGEVSNARPVFSNNVVTGNNYVGGIVGENDANAQLKYCQTSGGQILANGCFVGGYAGLNRSAKDIATGKTLANEAVLVKGKYFVGGIFGGNIAHDSSGTVTIQADNGSTADKTKTYHVEGEAFVGGIIGGNLAALPAISDINPYTDTPLSTTQDNIISNGTLNIVNSANQGSVTATRYVGGIIGYNYSSCTMSITSSANNGTVTANATATTFAGTGAGYYYIGGITGRNSSAGLIKLSNNNGNVNSPSLYTGGIVEVNEGKITSCANSGTIHSDTDNAGGIAGLNKSLSTSTVIATIDDCTSTGKVEGQNCIGGFVGQNEADIINCNLTKPDSQSASYTGASGKKNIGGIVGINTGLGKITNCNTKSGIISGTENVGGIVGYNNTTMVLDTLTNSASVSGSTNIGGIVGSNDGTTIQNCTNTGEISCIAESAGCAGGITSSNTLDKKIINCKNFGKISAVSKDSYAGGITADNFGEITDCTNGGTVSGYSNTGGIAGKNSGTITSGINNVTAFESITYTPVVSTKSVNSGGIAGYNIGILKDCSNKGGTVSGYSLVGGLVGYNTASGKMIYTDEGITNTLKTIEGTIEGTIPSPADADINAVDRQIGGVIGRNDSTDTAMKTLSGYINKAAVKFNNVSTNSYAGGITAINVNGHIIDTCDNQGIVTGNSSITVTEITTDTSRVMGTGGIVGKNENGAAVQNITLTEGTVMGVDVVGGIIGLNYGTMTDCKNGSAANFVTVKGTGSYAGGYIGYDASASGVFTYTDTATLSNYGEVSGYSYVGGIVGRTTSNIAYCQNSKTVSSEGSDEKNTAVGGIVGYLYPSTANITVQNCQNNGTVTAKTGTYIGGIVGRAQGKSTPIIAISNCENLSGAEVRSTSSAQFIGGIVGSLEVGSSAQNCINKGLVTNIYEKSGGITGYALSATIKDCQNYGTVTATNTTGISGGIAGFVESGTSAAITDIENCTNEGIVSGSAKIGGIVGYLYTSSNLSVSAIINNCTNGKSDDIAKGSVSGTYDIGGIIGSSAAKISSLNITKCINYGKIYGSNTSVAGGVGGIMGTLSASTTVSITDCQNHANIFDVAIYSGGIVGYMGASGLISNCTNDGNIGTVSKTNISFSDMGGIAGRITSNATISQCTNSGKLGADVSVQNYHFVGGIAGILTSNATVSDCINTGVIKTLASWKSGNVGGIVGSLSHQNAIIKYCTNKNSVITDTNYVGGIAGYSKGSIVSCITTIDSVTESKSIGGTDYQIAGYQYIGGLVGKNDTINSILYSGPVQTNYTPTGNIKDLVLSYNSMNVTGYQYIGGVVGVNNSGGILTIYNQGKVYAQNTVPNEEAYVGGIVGQTTFTAARGSITNCYNLGTVSQAFKGTYIGGLIGWRTADSANIKTSYYLEGLIVNADKSLSVGNEDATAAEVIYDVQDIPQNYTARTIASSTTLNDIQNKMKEYDYTLNYTVDAKGVSDYEYRYTFSWTAVQGFVSGYQLRLYEVTSTGLNADGKPIAAIGSTIDTSSSALQFYQSYDTNTNKTINGRLTTSKAINFDAAHVGKTYAVAVVTLGMVDAKGDPYSFNSDYEGVQPTILAYRKILPVLPKPTFTATPVIGKNYKITIDSTLYTDNFPNKAPANTTYPNFTWGNNPVYQAYSNGLSNFSGTDYYDSIEHGTANKASVATNEHEYTLLCDYTNFSNDYPYHKMQLRAISNDTVDGYASSPMGTLEFKVYTKLNYPTDISAVYTGTTIVPAYDVSFKNVANNSGYTVQILADDGITVIAQKTLTASALTGTTTCSILDTNFLTSGNSFINYSNKTLYIKIMTLGEDVYLPSDFSPNVPFKVPYKLDAPEITYTADPDDDTLYTISWTKLDDASKYNMRVYLADDDGVKTSTLVFEYKDLTDNSKKIELNDADAAKKVNPSYFGRKYVIEVDAIGKKGISLDSNTAAEPFIVHARLVAPVIVSPIELTNHETPEYKIDWTDAAADDANCSGYKVIIMLSNGSAITTQSISHWDIKTLTYEFDEIYVGKEVVIKIVALGKGGTSSNSLYSNPFTLTVAKRLAPPTNVAFTKGFESDPQPIGTYEEKVHKITWTKSTAEVAVIGHYLVKLYGQDGVEMTDVSGLNGKLIAATDNEYSFSISPEYAGQPLTATVTTLANTVLNSLPVSLDAVTLAKALLPTPTISSFVHTDTINYDKPKLIWTANSFATGYELTIQYLDESGNVIGDAVVKTLHSVNDLDTNVATFTYSYTADSDKLPTAYKYRATVKMLGDTDNKHYVNSSVSANKELIIPHKLVVTGFNASLNTDRDKLHLEWLKTDHAVKYAVTVSYIGSTTVDDTFDVANTQMSCDYSFDSIKYLAADSIKVTIKAIGNGTQYLDSDPQSKELSKLILIGFGLSLDTDTKKLHMVWDQTAHTAKYVLTVSYVGSATEEVTFNVASTEISADYSLDNAKYLAVSSIKVTIKAIGDEPQYLDSKPQELSKLILTGFDVSINAAQELHIVWDETANAVEYAVTVSYIGTSTDKDTFDVENSQTSTDYPLDSEKYLAADSIKVAIKAVGDGTQYLDSEVISKEFSKLVVTGFDASLNTDRDKLNLVWDKTENAVKYAVTVSYVGTSTDKDTFDVENSKTSAEYLLDSAKYLDADSIKVTIKAIGDGTQYFDSEGKSKEFDILDKVTDFTVTSPANYGENFVLAWDDVENASDYILTVSYLGGAELKQDTVNIADGSTETYEYTIDSAICSDALSLEFSIKARGDGTQYLDSDVTQNTEEYSIPVENVTLLVNNKGTDTCSVDISWNKMVSANGYTLKITEIDVEGTKTNYDVVDVDEDTLSYSITGIHDADAHISSFEISVYAKDNEDLSDCSIIKHKIQFRALTAPQSGSFIFSIFNLILLIINKLK